MIERHHSLQQAEVIYQTLLGLVGEGDEIGSWSLQCFDNCREQGYVLSGMHMKQYIAFTLCRISDSIRVYEYTKTQAPSNLPSEDSACWEKHKTFLYNKQFQCAEHIVSRMKYHYKKYKRSQ